MANTPTKVTMIDVAQACGFSLSTVSLALNQKPGLPQATRAKVLEAAQKLGYIPRKGSSRARGIGLRGNMALIAGRQPAQEAPARALPAYAAAQLLAGVEAACREENLVLHYATYPAGQASGGQEIAGLVEQHALDGLLLAGVDPSAALRQAAQQNRLPVVLVEPGQPENGFDAFFIDHYAGGFAAARHLIERGHSQIAGLDWQPAPPSAGAGLLGYQQALALAGLPTYTCLLSPEDAAPLVQLLGRHPHITAVFASQPGAAALALRAALAVGRRVPEELSIVAVDSPSLAETALPALTTLEAAWDDLGRLAVRALLNRAARPGLSCVTTYLHPRLVERRSVAGRDPG